MANADHIVDSVESVSLHLSAIADLADTLTSCVDQGGTRVYQYEVCLAFRLLAEAAQSKLDAVHSGVTPLLPLKRDMDALARAVARA
jgi:hypothetical protein